MDDASLSDDVRLNDGRLVDHHLAIGVHDTNVVSSKSHEFHAASIDDHLRSENSGNDVSSKNSGKCGLIKSRDSVGNGSKSGIGGSKDG